MAWWDVSCQAAAVGPPGAPASASTSASEGSSGSRPRISRWASARPTTVKTSARPSAHEQDPQQPPHSAFSVPVKASASGRHTKRMGGITRVALASEADTAKYGSR